MKQRPVVKDAAKSVAQRFPESMRRFGPTDLYGDCWSAECSRRARSTCPQCGGEHCLAHAEHSEHAGGPANT
jgi:hypothetical protein